jgi:hypothetical protein
LSLFKFNNLTRHVSVEIRRFRIIYGKHKIFTKSKLLSKNETDEIGKVTDDLKIKSILFA